jgi:RNA polymerase sigma-70 factor (ECF subfamily)
VEDELGGLKSGLAAGKPASYQEAYDRFGSALFRAAARWLGGRNDAEDAVQDVFSSLVRSRERIRHVTDLKAYLFVALRHAVERIARQRQQRLAARLDETLAGPARPRDDGQDAERLWTLLSRLPAEQRDVLILKTQGGLTFAQIGRVQNISPHTAASRYRYGLEKLRQMLEAQP